ncbi:MAG: hypothetical protein JWR80_4816 [Bradyrhizobium sp.]|nr:hypothetical protein [Bradyrhizobium sp.]
MGRCITENSVTRCTRRSGFDYRRAIVSLTGFAAFNRRCDMNARIASAGISWFDREDYPRVREIMVDAHVLPLTYDAWREKAESQERRAKASGLTVVRAIIKPDDFVAWCASQRLDIDAKARTAFAAEFAMARMKN